MFAYGTALMTAKPLTLGNNATSVFAGDKSITFTSAVIIEAGNNDITLANTLTDGATLNLNAGFSNLKAHGRTLNFRGAGSTVVTGALPNGSVVGQAVSIQIAPGASLTLAGAANTYTGKTTMAQGRLILSKTLGATGWLDFNGGTIEGTLDLTGVNALSHSVFFGGDPATFTGAFNVELSNAANALNWAASRTLVNDLGAGKVLTAYATLASGKNNTNSRTLNFRGTGNTVWSGAIQNQSTSTGLTSVNFEIDPGASFTMSGAAQNTYAGERGRGVIAEGNRLEDSEVAAVTEDGAVRKTEAHRRCHDCIDHRHDYRPECARHRRSGGQPHFRGQSHRRQRRRLARPQYRRQRQHRPRFRLHHRRHLRQWQPVQAGWGSAHSR